MYSTTVFEEETDETYFTERQVGIQRTEGR